MRISDWSSDVCSSDLFGEADLRLAGAAHLLEGQADMVEVELRQLVEPVLMLARVECEAHHQRVVIRRDAQPVLREHADVIFEVVPDLQPRSEERRVGKEGVRTCRYRWSPGH